MLEELMQTIITWLKVNPHWAGYITFFIAFIESLAVVGTIIPGSVTMTAIGVLIGTGVIPMESTFIWAILGAIAGDSASYFIGYYCKDRLREIWPFKKHPNLLARGELFFYKHGTKSVFIGRFTGPLRSIVPVVAGMMKMPQKKFLLANITSAVLWSFLYILPGVFLGAAATELGPTATLNTLLIVLAALIGIWLIVVLTRYLSAWTCGYANSMVMKIWLYLCAKSAQQYRVARGIIWLIHHPAEYNAHQQLARCLALALSLLTFGLVILSIRQQGWIMSYNLEVFTLLQSMRNSVLDKFFAAYTMFGDRLVMIILINGLFVYFASKKQWALAWLWLGHGIVTLALIYGIKLIINVPRPEGFQIIRSTASFPSGHVALYSSVIGLLTFLLTTESQKIEWRQRIYIGFFGSLSILCLARLYLGAHWLSDIIGSLLLGVSLLLGSILIYRRLNLSYDQSLRLGKVSAITLGGAWLVVVCLNFSTALHAYQPLPPNSGNLSITSSAKMNKQISALNTSPNLPPHVVN